MAHKHPDKKHNYALTMRVDPVTRRRIEEIATDKDVPFSQVVRWAIKDYVLRYKGP
jgi:predicted transcriptional regulator